jgi:small-conductance mechanosensitive channel
MWGLYLLASWASDHENGLQAVAIAVGAVIVAVLVDRVLLRRGQRLGQAVVGGELSPVANTRFRLVRRLIFVTIVVIGAALALTKLPGVQEVATGILASSAVVGLVVGFAARQTLANFIAGILIAITQPIRIGDLVTFEEQTGEVEDVKLSYSYIRLDDGRRLIVPNERLAQSSIVNHTVVDPRVQVEVSIWLRRSCTGTDRLGGGRGSSLCCRSRERRCTAERDDVGGKPPRTRQNRS